MPVHEKSEVYNLTTGAILRVPQGRCYMVFKYSFVRILLSSTEG